MKDEALIAVKAIIFDMDGVLVDSEKHWQDVGSELVGRLVPSWNASDREKIMGLGCEPLYELLCDEYEFGGEYGNFKEEYHEAIRSVYVDRCGLLDGVLDLLIDLKKSGMLLAVATSSLRDFLDIVIERFGLGEIFDVALSVSEVNGAGKPDPEIYLRTAERLGVAVDCCMAIEDSWAGVSSATRAGMKVIGLKNGFNDSQDLSAASCFLDGFRGVSAEAVVERFYWG